MLARLRALYRRLLPYPSAGAGVPGLAPAAPRRTLVDLSDLTRSARKSVIADRCRLTTAALREARPAPLTPHDVLFADIRARRATKGA